MLDVVSRLSTHLLWIKRAEGAKKLNVPRNGGMSFPDRWTKHLQRRLPLSPTSRLLEPEHMTSKNPKAWVVGGKA